jgi:cystathionine beta-lyase family protein involved in aluminum resistance
VLDATEELYESFLSVDCAAAENLQRVQAAMAEERVGPHYFAGSTGYGHGDLGRAAYDQVCTFGLKQNLEVT